MNNQWQPSEVLVDSDDSRLDQPITYDTPTQSVVQQAIVEPITPIFPPSHYLKLAGDLIEKGWITHAEARNALGQIVEPESEDAEEWCTIGAKKAAIKYAPVEFQQYMLRYLQSIFNAANTGLMLKHSWVWNNNDARNQYSKEDHALIVKMFRRAQAFAESKPEVDTWPNAPFQVTKVHHNERLHNG